MADKAEWEAKVKVLLKSELKRQGLTYYQLANELAKIGVMETETSVRNKVARGNFTAVFLIQCLAALGTRQLQLEV